MRTPWFQTLLLLLALLCGGAPAAANERDAFTAHVERGTSLYRQGQYEEAIRELQAAYGLRQVPMLLLNLGQAHRKLGHARDALGFYEFYLRVEPNPKPEIKAELDRYIQQTRELIRAAVRARSTAQATPEDPPPQTQLQQPLQQPVRREEPRPHPPAARRPLYKRWGFWAALGAVVAGGVVAGAVVAGTRGPSYPEGIEYQGLSF